MSLFRQPKLFKNMLLLTLLAAAGCQRPGSVSPDRLRIAAASDLKYVLDEFVPIFHKAQPRAQVEVVTDASGILYRRILDGARFDLFLAGDELYPQQLVDRQLASEAGPFRFAHGVLVLWLATPTALDPSKGLPVLLDPKVQRIAMAKPTVAPYGKIAQLALRQANIEPQVEKKLLIADNLLQAAELAETGLAQAALLSPSLVLSTKLKDRGRWQRLPAEAHPPLVQAGLLLPGANSLAASFRDVLVGAQGQDVLRRHGYLPPTKPKP